MHFYSFRMRTTSDAFGDVHVTRSRSGFNLRGVFGSTVYILPPPQSMRRTQDGLPLRILCISSNLSQCSRRIDACIALSTWQIRTFNKSCIVFILRSSISSVSPFLQSRCRVGSQNALSKYSAYLKVSPTPPSSIKVDHRPPVN